MSSAPARGCCEKSGLDLHDSARCRHFPLACLDITSVDVDRARRAVSLLAIVFHLMCTYIRTYVHGQFRVEFGQ